MDIKHIKVDKNEQIDKKNENMSPPFGISHVFLNGTVPSSTSFYHNASHISRNFSKNHTH